MNKVLYILVVIFLFSCKKDENVGNIFIDGNITLLDEFGDSTIFIQSGVRVSSNFDKTFTDQLGNFTLGNVDKVGRLVFRKNYYEDLKLELSHFEGEQAKINETMFHKPSTWVNDLEVHFEQIENTGYFILSFSGFMTPFDEKIDKRSFEVFIDTSPNVGPDKKLMSFVFHADQENQQFLITLPNAISFYEQGIDDVLFAVAYGRSSFIYDGYPVVMHNNRSNLFEFIPY